jgi:hypothetical protein
MEDAVTTPRPPHRAALARTPMQMMQGLAAAAVPLPPDAVLLSTAHPVADSVCIASTQEDGVWSLPARNVALERAARFSPFARAVDGPLRRWALTLFANTSP